MITTGWDSKDKAIQIYCIIWKMKVLVSKFQNDKTNNLCKELLSRRSRMRCHTSLMESPLAIAAFTCHTCCGASTYIAQLWPSFHQTPFVLARNWDSKFDTFTIFDPAGFRLDFWPKITHQQLWYPIVEEDLITKGLFWAQ